MTDFLALVTNPEDVSQLAATALEKYDSHTVIAQSQLGRELVIENSKLIVDMDIMSDVMRDNKKGNKDLKVTLEATEHKLGCPLTAKELVDYRSSRQILLSTTLQTNQKLLNKCKSKLQLKLK